MRGKMKSSRSIGKDKPPRRKPFCFLKSMAGCAHEIDNLSGQLIAVNDNYLRAAIARADWRIHLATWVVVVSGVLSLTLAGLLLWLLFYRVLFPLRGIVADAQLFRDERGSGERGDGNRGSGGRAMTTTNCTSWAATCAI